MAGLTIYSVGHSNRPLQVFLGLLKGHGVVRVADVRAYPASRRWPHFGREALAASLTGVGIRYEWLPALGGRRAGRGEASPHTAWTIEAFRHYADYTETAEFAAGLAQLRDLAAEAPTAFLCAEALWWQCHRRLIADQLVLAGHRVLHIETATSAVEHRLPSFARVDHGRLIYDGGTQLGLV